LPFVLCEFETWSLSLMVEHSQRGSRIRCWGKYSDPRGTSAQGNREYKTRSLMICIPHQLIFRCSKQEERDVGGGGKGHHLARIRDRRGAYRCWWGKL